MAVGVGRKVGLWKRAVGVGVSRRAWVAEMALPHSHWGSAPDSFWVGGRLISKAALPVS